MSGSRKERSVWLKNRDTVRAICGAYVVLFYTMLALAEAPPRLWLIVTILIGLFYILMWAIARAMEWRK